jgi:deazaflavin-dependent oxidoreductase (nitroreductase family)
MDLKARNPSVIAQFRAGGEIPGMHRDRLLLLTTRGAKTGRRRTTPMMFIRDGDDLYVVASNNGASREPAWYRNLQADPHVTVEIGDERFDAIAKPLEGPERDEPWQAVTEKAPFFLEHEDRAGRRIPLVRLDRTG